MVTDSSQYKFFKASFDNVYKENEDAGLLSGNPPCMLEGLELPDHFTDPTENRFLPLDFQDFWICQDVNESFNFMRRYSQTSFYYEGFCTPWFQRQPQCKNYEYFSPWGGHMYSMYCGYELTYTAVRPVQTAYGSIGFSVVTLCADSGEAPGLLAQITSENPVYIGRQSQSGYSYPEYLLWQGISSGTLCGDYKFSDVGQQDHDISAYWANQGPYFTEALSAWLDEIPKTQLQIGNRYINCNTPAGASADWVNFAKGYEADYMAYWLDDESPSCMYYRKHRNSYLSAWQEDKRDYVHNGITQQGIQWSTSRIPNSSPSMYRQYCSEMREDRIPSDYPNNQEFRLMMQSPTYDYYGDATVSVYIPYYVNTYPNGGDGGYLFYAKRFVLEMERSPYWFHKYRNLRRYVMQSKRKLSYAELFGMWEPFNESSARTAGQNLRAQAGLSAWSFSDGAIPRDNLNVYSNSMYVYTGQPFIVWKWNHPLVSPDGTTFPNQDEPQQGE